MNTTTSTTTRTVRQRAARRVRAEVERTTLAKAAARLGVGRPTCWRWFRAGAGEAGGRLPSSIYARHILEVLTS